MPNYKEIARLKKSGLSIRMIAKSTGCSRVMVTKVLKCLQEKERVGLLINKRNVRFKYTNDDEFGFRMFKKIRLT